MSGRSVAFLNEVSGLRPRSALAVAGLSLLAATLLLFAFLPRYAVLDGQRLANPDLEMAAGEEVPRGWRRIGRGGEIARSPRGLEIRARDRRAKVGIAQILERPPQADAMRLRGRLAVPELDALRGEYRGARFFAAADRPSGPYRFRGRDLVRLFAPAPVADYVADVRLPKKRRRVGAALLLASARGRMIVERVELFWLRERPLFAAARLGLLGGWGLWLAMAGARFWWTAHRRLPAVLLLAGVLVAILLDLLPEKAGIALESARLRLLAGFAVGFLAAIARERDPLWRRVLLVLALVAAVEFAQLFGPGLGIDDLGDFGRGAAGALAGITVAALLRRLRA